MTPVSYSAAVLSVAGTLWLLIQGKEVLQPILVALICWFLIRALSRRIAEALHGGAARPGALATLLSVVLVISGVAALAAGVVRNIAVLSENAPLYQENLNAKLSGLSDLLGAEIRFDLDAALADMDLENLLVTLLGDAVGFITALVIVIVYTIFIFAEAAIFPKKIAALQLSEASERHVTEDLARIQRMIEKYFGVKCIIGVAQAVPTFLLLWWIGVDAPEFWAALIFVLSFVPTIGSLFGIVFPSLLALLQFPTLEPFFITLACLAVVQLVGSNWLEPKLTGDSLDLSPLVVLLGVFIGAALWGIVGALIAVPLLSIAMIVFAHIDSLRPVAVMLSGGQNVLRDAPARERAAHETATAPSETHSETER